MTERLPPHRSSASSRLQTLVARAVAVVIGAALLAGAFFVSVVFFAVAFVVGLCGVGVFLWKTRHIRRQIREQIHAQRQDPRRWPPAAGDVIEGTVIRSSDAEPRRD